MSRLAALAGAQGLELLGSCAPAPGDPVPPGTGSIRLLGPEGPRFWDIFRASPEFSDGAPDPLDRWSRRVIGGLAEALGATALFPFDGPPWPPFPAWALRTGRCFTSPVGLLVHDRHGLFVSFRGALALPGPLEPPAPPADPPCAACARPCLAACPVGAMTGADYDVAGCHAHLDRPAGTDCRDGCLVRRACPVGQGLRPAGQSAFHMRAFHRSMP